MDGIGVIPADPFDVEEFVELVCVLGGDAHPDEWTDVRLSRGSCHVWVTADEDALAECEPEHMLAYEQKLGSQVARRVDLAVSRTPGSDWVALEIIEAAARKWHVIVDNYHGRLYAADELRARAAADRSSNIFWSKGR